MTNSVAFCAVPFPVTLRPAWNCLEVVFGVRVRIEPARLIAQDRRDLEAAGSGEGAGEIGHGARAVLVLKGPLVTIA